MPLILSGNVASALGGEYEVANSCRFNDDDSARLAITPSGDGSAEKWTLSFWIKMCGITTDQRTIRGYAVSSGGSRSAIYIDASDQFSVGFNPGASGWTTCTLQDNSTNMRFRDPSAWYHFVIACDTTQGTAANRLKGYVNGVQKAFDAYPAEDMDTMYNKSGRAQYIGWRGYTTGYIDDYLAEVCWIDGTQYAASDFGEFDSDSPRIWKPKDVSGLTFGTNGYYLDFEDSSALGNDVSGNNNDLTSTNLAATDQSIDTCTNNFCTNNSIAPDTTGTDSHTFSEGNLIITTGSDGWWNTFGTIGITSGKWYYEYLTTGSGTIDQIVGFAKSNFSRGENGGLERADCYTLYAASDGNGKLYTDSATNVNKGSGYCWTFDDIIMVAIDCSSRKIWYGKNGTWLGSGDPANDSNEAQAISAEDMAYGLLPGFSGYHSGATALMNFGSPPTGFAISSGNADGNGYGNFEYAPPSGFYSLCTKNLAEFGG